MTFWGRLFGRSPRREKHPASSGDRVTQASRAPSPGTVKPEQEREIYSAFQKMREEERAKHARRTLENVRVRPGENPFTAGASALLQNMGATIDRSHEVALEKAAAKYHLRKEQVLSIVQRGDAELWGK